MLGALTLGLIGLGMYGMADEAKKIQKEHSEELRKNQEKLVEEMEEKGRANFEEATAARVDYALEKALFPGEPITTTIHTLRACLMDDEDIIYKQTGKKYEKRESAYDYNIRMLEEYDIKYATGLLKCDDIIDKKLSKNQLDKLKEVDERLQRRLKE